ncbi:ROK family transcriptional regulator [Kribbella sp. VKM Ac-2566]|jgi:predicted NBD/HSP70 family sugar kinase|uniref:ROK family transcriptional regulator n=1 Tax=Kribbella sp. VKM Ac-2566 TaxID=2512218 RepID=UPI00106286D3|nr:ROK family transcriptional regulator [Kribbella sp. VKM Ac-2566]TDW92497.1 putative NBD/HSP70 family sugar kinase [Kribbella sp. VKM Ac-2566]
MTLTDGRRPGSRGVAADHVSLRRNNLSVVLRHVRDLGPRSRARIAEETGLNKATVSSLVAELVERGLLREGLADSSRALGRPGQLVELDGTGVCGVGAEINVDYLAVAALDLAGDVVLEKRVPVDVAHLEPGATLDRLAGLVREAVAAVEARNGQLAGVTLAVPGLVQVETGELKLAPNLGWGELSVAQEMRMRLGEPTYPLHVDNEANLAALAAYAELRGTEGESMHDLVLLTGAVGVGGGVVAGGHLMRGGHGYSGEVGHMPVAPPGRTCGCGRTGCWETVVGLTALLHKATDRDDPVRDPALDVEQRLAGITRRAEAGDARTLSALKDVGTWLGIGGAILVNILNPDVLVLGGYFAVLGPWLKEPLEKAIQERVIAPDGGGCRVVRSELGFAAAVRGGAQISLDQVFVDPTRIGAAT